MFNIVIWYTYILLNDHHDYFTSYHLISFNYFSYNESFQNLLSRQLSNTQYSIVSYSYHPVLTSPELKNLTLGVCTFWSPHPFSPVFIWQPPICFLFLRVWLLLDSTYEWEHTVFIFLCLTYSTQHSVLRVHPCCCLPHSSSSDWTVRRWKGSLGEWQEVELVEGTYQGGSEQHLLPTSIYFSV